MRARRKIALRAGWGTEIWGLLLLAAFLGICQLYPVRALLAAELIFAALFVILAAFGAVLYLLGAFGERGVGAVTARMRAAVHSLAEAWRHFEAGVQRTVHRHHAPNAVK